MIVMKFGGTSVESAEAIQRVTEIVKSRLDRRPIVVVSAMGKTTNRLLKIADLAVSGQREEALRELMSLLKLCRALLTNDTGPMHVAAALGKPLVALFGPTEPRRTGPYGQLENVLRIELPCSPCMKSVCTWKNPIECLTAISPQAVFERAQKLVSQT